MPHPDGLPYGAGPDHAGWILRDRKVHASALMRAPRKPSNWWAFEREPWDPRRGRDPGGGDGMRRPGTGAPRAPERVRLCRHRAGDGPRSGARAGGCRLAKRNPLAALRWATARSTTEPTNVAPALLRGAITALRQCARSVFRWELKTGWSLADDALKQEVECPSGTAPIRFQWDCERVATPRQLPPFRGIQLPLASKGLAPKGFEGRFPLRSAKKRNIIHLSGKRYVFALCRNRFSKLLNHHIRPVDV
jgi:hypothetical protein